MTDSIGWGGPCGKKPAHREERAPLDLMSLRYRHGKGNCVQCERDRMIQRALARPIKAPGFTHLPPSARSEDLAKVIRGEK